METLAPHEEGGLQKAGVDPITVSLPRGTRATVVKRWLERYIENNRDMPFRMNTGDVKLLEDFESTLGIEVQRGADPQLLQEIRAVPTEGLCLFVGLLPLADLSLTVTPAVLIGPSGGYLMWLRPEGTLRLQVIPSALNVNEVKLTIECAYTSLLEYVDHLLESVPTDFSEKSLAIGFRRLQLAERDLPSLIADDELNQRCKDLLSAEGHYDRVIREACVILEDRVRASIGADRAIVGTALMERAFGLKGSRLRLSPNDQEQRGAMELYRGVMAFFRNAAGHNLIQTYQQEDAVRFVLLVDFLLGMIRAAVTAQSVSHEDDPADS